MGWMESTLLAVFGPLYGAASLGFVALVVFLFFVYMGRGVSLALERLLGAAGQGPSTTVPRRGIRWVFGLVGLVMALQILGLRELATTLLATGGLVAVVLGFAFREIGENLLAGVFLGITRPFEVDDLIESSGHTGRVREIDLRHVHLRAADGSDIFIPSAEILRNVLVNFTRDGLRRGDFTVGIDYLDSMEMARERLLEAARGVPEVLAEPEVTIRLSGFTPQYAELQVLFWVDVEKGPGLAEVRTEVMEACLEALKVGGFTLSANVTTGVELSPVRVAVDRESP